MFEPLDLLLEQRRQDLVNEARRESLARQAVENAERGNPAYYGALAALGRTLTMLGGQLEQRYGDVCPELPEVAYE
jgi:hypothetical protein